jgi:PAS domain S-box-containing protein
MKPNPFVISPAPKGQAAAATSRPELLQQAFAKEMLEFGPACFQADTRGEITWSNAAFRKITETKAGGKQVGQVLPLKDIAEEIDVKRQPMFREDALASGAVLRSRIVPLFDERGQLAGFGGLLNLSAEAVEKTDENPVVVERHMDFIRLSSDWMWETDAAFNLQMVTHRVNNVLGFSPHELIGRNLMSMVSSEPLRQALRRRLERLSPFRDQPFDADDSNGRRKLFLMSAAPIFDKDGSLKGFRGAATDITELTRREESLRSAKEAAEVASRAKSHFLANMSHELRTPLNAIIGFTDVMRMGLLGPVENPEYRAYVGDIHGSAQRLLEVINDILDMSRIETGEVELHEAACNIEELFESARRIVHSRMEARAIKFSADLSPRLPRINADKRKMKQILVNLLGNAVKFTAPGGRVRLAATIGAEGGVTITVEDNGIGIAPEHLERVMEPFAQVEADLDRRFEGIGMGLPLSRGLARLHGGDLQLESTVGRGTRATVTLPPERLIEGGHLQAVK